MSCHMSFVAVVVVRGIVGVNVGDVVFSPILFELDREP